MAAALITVATLATTALLVIVVSGFTAATPAQVSSHVGLAIFTTLVILLSHSLTMFYLIGKGKAIREAVVEGHLASDIVSTMSRLRRPVFGAATLAIGLTMATAILGGGVDTGVLPPMVHSTLGILALLSNLHALRVEVTALASMDRLARDVNTQLGV
jgi:hypothetical protein